MIKARLQARRGDSDRHALRDNTIIVEFHSDLARLDRVRDDEHLDAQPTLRESRAEAAQHWSAVTLTSGAQRAHDQLLTVTLETVNVNEPCATPLSLYVRSNCVKPPKNSSVSVSVPSRVVVTSRSQQSSSCSKLALART